MSAHNEVERAQWDQDHHPHWSPYWDSRAGQESLDIAIEHKLQPATTEQFRREWHRDEMEAARQDMYA